MAIPAYVRTSFECRLEVDLRLDILNHAIDSFEGSFGVGLVEHAC